MFFTKKNVKHKKEKKRGKIREKYIMFENFFAA